MTSSLGPQKISQSTASGTTSYKIELPPVVGDRLWNRGVRHMEAILTDAGLLLTPIETREDDYEPEWLKDRG